MFTLAETRRGASSGGRSDDSVSEAEFVAGERVSFPASSAWGVNAIRPSAAALMDSLDASDAAAVAAAVAAVQQGASELSARRVTLHTSLGPIELELYWRHAPQTCINFFLLSKRGYYDGCLFHRVCKGKWVKSGDPTGTGRGGTSVFGKPFKDEIHPGNKP